MAERPAPARESRTQPIETESPEVNNDFWVRFRRLEAEVEEARKLLEELKEGTF